MNSDQTAEVFQLDELMMAMDVVDTLRHREELVLKEINDSDRREKLVKKIKDIYAAQGLDVPEDIITRGVDDLEEDRFSYKPAKKSLSTWLAGIYISRKRWIKRFRGLAIFLLMASVMFYFSEVRPEQRARGKLPKQIEFNYKSIRSASQNSETIAQAERLYNGAMESLRLKDYQAARTQSKKLASFSQQIRSAYTIRIINKPGQPSGIWRTPDVNQQARNYYLIVEAVGNMGDRLKVRITNEETNETRHVRTWGIRVDKNTFNKIASDKQDDGILSMSVIGHKKSGKLQPDYSIPTTGGTIFNW